MPVPRPILLGQQRLPGDRQLVTERSPAAVPASTRNRLCSAGWVAFLARQPLAAGCSVRADRVLASRLLRQTPW
jgi:hypothetical protein